MGHGGVVEGAWQIWRFPLDERCKASRRRCYTVPRSRFNPISVQSVRGLCPSSTRVTPARANHPVTTLTLRSQLAILHPIFRHQPPSNPHHFQRG